MSAGPAYDAFAGAYDAYTADYAYDRWLATVVDITGELGLRGREALDAACGTANSTLPLVERRFDVTACDLSPGMVARARRKLPDPRRVGVADLRRLPFRARFDFATCLDDGINYLLGERELRLGMRSMARSLRPGGVLAFDVNTLGTLRAAYSAEEELELGDWRFRWRGRTAPDAPAGSVAASTLAISARRRLRDGWAWRLAASALHRQSHHDEGRVRDALSAAGMEVLAVLGQSPGVVLSDHLDEQAHTKALYFARRCRRRPPLPRRLRTRSKGGGRVHIRP
jgi:SAM-dependent methyltransferase